MLIILSRLSSVIESPLSTYSIQYRRFTQSMADFTASSSNCTPTTSSSSSCFQRTVTLYDWWLVKSSQGNNHCLAISGISSTKEEAVRVFNSAPIIKRYDEVSLETVDAIYVLIRGFINKQRTLDNGFTPQVRKSPFLLRRYCLKRPQRIARLHSPEMNAKSQRR